MAVPPVTPAPPEDTGEMDAGAEHVIDPGSVGRRVGATISIVVDLVVLLWLLDAAPDWHIGRFLTDDFTQRLVPVISVSIVVDVFVNVANLVLDWPRVRSAGQVLTLLVSAVVIGWTIRVFPFDFSDYANDWAPVATVVLIVGLLGTIAGAMVELSKLVRGVR